MSFAVILEATLGIKLFPDLFCRRKIIPGAIEGNGRHPMPKIGRITRMQAVGQINSFLQEIPEYGPGNFAPSSTESTAVHLFSFGPEPAASGSPEELARLDVHSLALPAGGKRENEGYELRERELSVACKILGRALALWIDFSRDETEKICDDTGYLA